MEAAASGRGPAVAATPAALEVIDRLEAAHGALAFFQSGGCCDGTSPICLKDGELPAGPNDLRLGDIGGARFYIDSDQYRRWGTPQVNDAIADVEAGRVAARIVLEP